MWRGRRRDHLVWITTCIGGSLISVVSYQEVSNALQPTEDMVVVRTHLFKRKINLSRCFTTATALFGSTTFRGDVLFSSADPPEDFTVSSAMFSSIQRDYCKTG